MFPQNHLENLQFEITQTAVVVILVEFDKYWIWDEQACLKRPSAVGNLTLAQINHKPVLEARLPKSEEPNNVV